MTRMMKIQIKNNIAEFELNFNFYDFPSIIETSHEFTESCWIGIKGSDNGKSIFIRIEPKEKTDNAKEAVNHFFNYLLGIMNRKIKEIY